MMMEQLSRVLDRHTASFVNRFAHPRRACRQLVAHCIQRNELDLIVKPELTLTNAQIQAVDVAVDRMRSGTPLGYIYGSLPFLEWDFKVDARALCPRPETEALCEHVRHGRQPTRILDLGCGSGVIGLSLALSFPRAKVVLVDRSPDACALTRENMLDWDLDDRCSVVQSDWWEGVERAMQFDLVVSNPPYVAQNDQVEPGVRMHEPALALNGGIDGCRDVRRILDGLEQHLVASGDAFFELGPNHHTLLQPDLQTRDWAEIAWLPDPWNIPRYLHLHKKESS